MKKTKLVGAFIPALLFGTPALASTSNSRFKVKKAAVQKKHEIKEDKKDPFSVFGGEVAKKDDSNDVEDVLAFLKDNELLSYSDENENEITGDSDKDIGDYRREFVGATCTIGGFCGAPYTPSNTCTDNSDCSSGSPEMDVTDNDDTAITDGDTTPSSNESTNFGSVGESSGSQANTFKIKNTGSADLTLSGSPKVSLGTGTHFSVTAQPSSPVSSSGQTTFTITFNPTSVGTHNDTVSITNNDGNENPYNFSITGTGTDDTAPTLAEVTPVTTPTNDNTPDVVFSTNETGTASVGGSCGTSTSTTISSTGNQTFTLTQGDNSSALADGTYSNCTVTVTDAAGNASSALTLTSFIVDTTAPRISSIERKTPASTPTASDTLILTVTFNEAVSNLDTADFSVSGTTGSVTNVASAGGNAYDITISGGDLSSYDGEVTLSFAGGQNVADSAGNTLSNTTPTGNNNNSYTVDNAAPTVSSIAPQGSPNASDVSMDFRVTFDENASNVSTGDFELTKTSSANGTISSVSEVNATTKDVTVNSISGVGTLRLDLKSNTDITDASGNGNGTNGNVAAYTSGTTHTVLIPNSDASLSAANGVDESSMISLPSTANTLAQKVNLFDFNISDGGGGDTLSTNVNQIVINTSGTGPFDKVKWLLNGSDVSNIEGNYTSNKITFSDFNISIADGSSEIYTLSGYFKNPTGLTDNSTFGFSVDGDTDLTLESSKTQMATTSTVTNSTNAKVDINATKLIFKTMPSN